MFARHAKRGLLRNDRFDELRVEIPELSNETGLATPNPLLYRPVKTIRADEIRYGFQA